MKLVNGTAEDFCSTSLFFTPWVEVANLEHSQVLISQHRNSGRICQLGELEPFMVRVPIPGSRDQRGTKFMEPAHSGGESEMMLVLYLLMLHL